MSIVPLNKIPDIIEDVISGKRKLISFDRPDGRLKQYLMRSEYTLLPREIPQDQEAACLEAGWKPLSQLRQEQLDKVVIAASDGARDEAWKKIAPYGDFPVINYFTPDYLYPFLPALRALSDGYKRQKRTTGRRGIIIRGAFMGDSSFQAIQKIAADYPDDYIIISTWNTISNDDKERYDAICDCLVLNEQPPVAGIQNRNFQLACIQGGIRAALNAGVEKILVARCDYLFANKCMLDSFDALLTAYPSEAARACGQKGRLIIPDFGTRYYIPYHVGDMLTYGWAEDVARCWMSIPRDTREFPDNVHSQLNALSIKDASRLGIIVETYFGASFLEFIGKPPQWTLADSLSMYRDFFITVNYSEMGMFWFKRVWFNHVTYCGGPLRKYLTHQLWLSLVSCNDISSHADLDIEKTTWGDFERGQ